MYKNVLNLSSHFRHFEGRGRGGGAAPAGEKQHHTFSTIFQNYLDQISQIHTHMLAQV